MLYTIGQIAKKYHVPTKDVYDWRDKIYQSLLASKLEQGINGEMERDQYGRKKLLAVYEPFFPKVPEASKIFSKYRQIFVLISRNNGTILAQECGQNGYTLPSICNLQTDIQTISPESIKKILGQNIKIIHFQPILLYRQIDILNSIPMLLETYAIFTNDPLTISKYTNNNLCYVSEDSLKKSPHISRHTAKILDFLSL